MTSFKTYVFNERRNRITLWLAVAAIIIQFIIFKYFYPFASYIHGDSFEYLNTAYLNSDINTYMVGYARFLRLFSVFSSSDFLLTGFQYLLLQGSSLYFLFTLFYFCKPGKTVQIILLCFMVLNPLFLFLANLISSDGFFVALSLIWFALLIHILHWPTTQLMVWHAIVLFIAFTVRYNALIYPAIALPVFLLSKQTWSKKVIGWGAGVVLCGCFMLYTGNKYKALTGNWQYSPFGGWLMANNAMYAYRYVNKADRKPVPERFRKLDNSIRVYFDSTRDVKKYPAEELIASTGYMWDSRLPLYVYRNNLFKGDTNANEQKKWASMGSLYKAYGLFIIKAYPLYYVRHFLWPNAIRYYAPPVEYLATYNSEKNTVLPIAQVWFRYKSNKVSTRTGNLQIYALEFYPILAGAMNVIFVCGLTGFFLLGGNADKGLFLRALWLVTAMWLINAAFTIFASPAALRFQSFPVLLVSVFAMLLIDQICQIAVRVAAEEKKIAGLPKPLSLSEL